MSGSKVTKIYQHNLFQFYTLECVDPYGSAHSISPFILGGGRQTDRQTHRHTNRQTDTQQ